MSDIGVEVGQKMRSAIKAKLTELDCYVDDELPDYIMVMIANKRTKSQMKEDLQLFLSVKTSTFVDWLHIVLKKLKEVHVTNPDVFKKPLKRKSGDLTLSEEDAKKVKKEKKEEAKAIKKAKKVTKIEREPEKSLTDDLPITANKLSELRKIVIMKENQEAESNSVVDVLNSIDDNSFDIPLLSEISSTNEEELQILESKIKSVKSRLGLQVESDDEDCLNIKPDPDDLLLNEQLPKPKETPKVLAEPTRKITVEHIEPEKPTETIDLQIEDKRSVHTRITFDEQRDSLKAKYAAIINKHVSGQSQVKKKSVLERLGKRREDFKEADEKDKLEEVKKPDKFREDVRNKLNLKAKNKDLEEKTKEDAVGKLGVPSKVYIPPKKQKTPEEEIGEDEELERTFKEVASTIKIKPRVIPPKSKQANANLLFKAVAEAQRSVKQTPSVGNAPLSPETKDSKTDTSALFTKKYKEKMESKYNQKVKLLEEEKLKLKKLLDVSIETKDTKVENSEAGNQKFIITLDGIDASKFPNSTKEDSQQRSIVITKRAPSPIVFDKLKPAKVAKYNNSHNIIAAPLKVKERCKFWPGCRLADKCEFLHPTAPCKLFPNCKYEEKCLYVHPACKFETSCTRRDCPYSHTGKTAIAQPSVSSLQKPISQICKFFPNCSNLHCAFYHPRLCKYGVFCKNQSECNFVHSFPSKSSHLTWRSDHKAY